MSPRAAYLQPGVSVVWPGGWHLPTWGPEFPSPPPLLPGPKAGSPRAGAALIPSAHTDKTAANVFRLMVLLLLASVALRATVAGAAPSRRTSFYHSAPSSQLPPPHPRW